MEKIDTKKLLTAETGTKKSVEISETIRGLELSDSIEGKRVIGKLKIMKLDDTLLVRGDFVAGVVLICDRCLENFKAHIPFRLEREYNIDRSEQLAEALFVDKYGQIDITEPIREEIILNIPLNNYCENGCLGICQGCGVNLNQEKCCCKKKKKDLKRGSEGRE